MYKRVFENTVQKHQAFKEWFYFIEALDAKLKDILQKSKYGEATPEQIQNAIQELETEYENKPSPDKPTAFKFMQTKLNLKAGESKEEPKDPFFANYYKKLKSKQIFPEEYKTLEYFKDENKELLTEMMEKLRTFISQNKITLSFDNKPIIKFKNEILNYNDFTQFMGNIHSIEGQLADVNVDKYQNPAFLEMLHKKDLVAKGDNIWVFKGDDPLKCRIMGKSQSWCIVSSSSAEDYFGYRHGYGQTQYFIFDFNKAPDDPARYVNPGVAPAGQYSEWVDRKNSPNKINGYKSIRDYIDYLKSKGIDTNVFVADPITQQEKDIQKLIDSRNLEGARNYPDERKTKDGIPYMFYYYLKLINKLTDEEFDSLSDIEKEEFLLGKSEITKKQFEYIESKRIKFLKEYINSIGNIATLLTIVENADKMAKFIVQYKKELNNNDIYQLLHHTTNKDEIAKLILQRKKELNNSSTIDVVYEILHYAKNKAEIAELLGSENINKLLDRSVHDLLEHAKNKDEIAKLIIQHKKELSSKNVQDLLYYAKNKAEIAELLGSENINKLSDGGVYNLLAYGTNKNEIAKLLGSENINKLSDENVSNLLRNAGNRDKMAKLLLTTQK